MICSFFVLKYHLRQYYSLWSVFVTFMVQVQIFISISIYHSHPYVHYIFSDSFNSLRLHLFTESYLCCRSISNVTHFCPLKCLQIYIESRKFSSVQSQESPCVSTSILVSFFSQIFSRHGCPVSEFNSNSVDSVSSHPVRGMCFRPPRIISGFRPRWELARNFSPPCRGE